MARPLAVNQVYAGSIPALGAILLLSACKVYLPPCEPGTEETERAHPGGGVTVKLSELAEDGGEP